MPFFHVDFEFDPEKSNSNKVKHGIDFVEAQALWRGKIVEAPGRTAGEVRTLVVGVIDGVHWTAVTTPRGNKTRIISVRRSTAAERTIYEKTN